MLTNILVLVDIEKISTPSNYICELLLVFLDLN